MNNISVKVVYRPTPSDSNLGNLHIRTTENRKSKHKSLGIQLPLKYWDPITQRVRPSYKKKHKQYNELINSTLERLKSSLNNLDVLKTSSYTILEFWNLHNANTINAGTAAIRQSSLKKFKKFLISINKENLRFQHLNPQLVQQYHVFLSKEVSPRSIKTYMGFFKSVVNQAMKQQVIPQYPTDPFLNTKIRSIKNKKAKALSNEVIKKIMDFKLPSKQAIFRDMFIFQILGGGMRVRDMLFLKWENIKLNNESVYLIYIQEKTKKQITSKLSYKALSYLHHIFNQTHQLHAVEYNLKNLNRQLELLEQWKKENKHNMYDNEKIEFSHYDVSEGQRYELDRISVSDAQRITLEENIKMYQTDLIIEYSTIINDYINKIPNSYIFHSLKGIEINHTRSIDPKTNVKIQGKIANYNYHLKKIGGYLEIGKITTHQARHSFTQLLVNSNINLYHIQQMLGHSSLTVTQNYTHSIHSTHLDGISDTLAGQF